MFLSGLALRALVDNYMVLHVELLHGGYISVRFVKCFISFQTTVDVQRNGYPPMTRPRNFDRSASSSTDFRVERLFTPYFCAIFQFFLQDERVDLGRRVIFSTDHTKNDFKKKQQKSSHAGTRTRVGEVKTRYPNLLDYMGPILLSICELITPFPLSRLKVRKMEHLPTLLDIVEKRCPKLRPAFLPNGISEKDAIKVYSEKHALPKPKETCDVCGDKEKELVPQIICSYNLETRKCIVTGVKVRLA